MEIFHESDTSAILQMLPSFGNKYAPLAMGYCYLFGVTPFRLKAKKLRLLLEELKRLFDAESFTFEKRKYAISHAGIAEALDAMIKRNFTRTLLNHNYLKQVMIGIAEREAQAAGRSAEKDLRKREGALMSGSRDGKSLTDHVNDSKYLVLDESVEPPPLKLKSMPEAHLTPEQIEKNKRHVQGLIKTITK